jgi:hypothetical protein
MLDKATEIALKFYDQHSEILPCPENNKLIRDWLDDNCLRFSLNNLNEAASALSEKLVRKYTEEEISAMTGDQYKRLVLPYCDDLSEDHRKQLQPREVDPIELLSSAEILNKIVIPEWKAKQTASAGQ